MNSIERRKENPNRLTITQILDNMEGVAELHYDGDMETNILSVFNTLSINDRRTFIRRAFKLLRKDEEMLLKKGLEEVVVDDTHIDRRSVDEERKLIGKENYKDQTVFKNWFYGIILGGMILFLLIATFISLSSATRAEDASLLKHTLDILELVFKTK